MDVKEIFEMRKQGRAEEAYEAILPLYRVHQGRYTTICMFWCASDMLKLRLQQNRYDEALKIFQALVRLYPSMDDDKEQRGHKQLLYHALALCDSAPKATSALTDSQPFSMIEFLENGGLQSLTPDDWATREANGHPVPSLAAQLIGQVHHELMAIASSDLAQRCKPIVREALKHRRNDMNFLRLQALVYRLTDEKPKAIDIYKKLLRRHHQSYLYSELSTLIDTPADKAALLAKALLAQREVRFRTKLHIQLAEVLLASKPAIAAYNLQESIRIRESAGAHVSDQQRQLQAKLASVQPATPAEATQFHKDLSARVNAFLAS